MTGEDYRQHIRAQLFPEMYPKMVFEDGSGFLLRDGHYLFLCQPLHDMDLSDLRIRKIKKRVAKEVHAFPMLNAFGLFVHAYGPETGWREPSQHIKVDKTGLHSIILQNINFLDPESGAFYNNRTSWGPLQFGFCGKVVERLEGTARSLAEAR